MRLDTNNAASILIDGNPYRKDLLKIIYGTSTITIRDQYGLVYDTIAYGSITNGITNAVFATMAELKQWISDHMFTSEFSASGYVAITPHDTNTISIARALYIGVGGDVVLGLNGNTPVTYKNLPAGTTLAVRYDLVKLTNTTATNLVALR